MRLTLAAVILILVPRVSLAAPITPFSSYGTYLFEGTLFHNPLLDPIYPLLEALTTFRGSITFQQPEPGSPYATISATISTGPYSWSGLSIHGGQVLNGGGPLAPYTLSGYSPAGQPTLYEIWIWAQLGAAGFFGTGGFYAEFFDPSFPQGAASLTGSFSNVTFVPEPGSALMLVLGLGGIAAWSVKRARVARPHERPRRLCGETSLASVR